MARSVATHLPQPVFHEPVFGEDASTADPTGFLTRHGSDAELYKEIGDLAKKDVVDIPASRAANDALFTLAEAYGNHRRGGHQCDYGRQEHPLPCARQFRRLERGKISE